MSRPSVTVTALPHIVEEMQMMKERMECMMNALKGRVSSDLDDLVHQTDSPFTMSVNSFPLPLKFRMPQVENYDGNKDPLDHLESFKTLIHLQGISDEIMCRAFPTTLRALQGYGSVGWRPTPLVPSKSWAPNSHRTLSRDTGIRSLLHA